MTKLTPGTWRFEKYSRPQFPDDPWEYDVSAPGWKDLDPDEHYSILEQVSEADARLISAAKELLGVVESVHQLWSDTADPELISLPRTLLVDVMAALAKVKA